MRRARCTSSAKFDGSGCEPAGENGTYFQFPLEQRELDPVDEPFGRRQTGHALDGVRAARSGPGRSRVRWRAGRLRGLARRSAAPRRACSSRREDRARDGGEGQRGTWQLQRESRADHRAISGGGGDRGRDDGLLAAGLRRSVLSHGAGRAEGSRSNARPVPNYFYVTKAVARAMLGRDAESAQPGTPGRNRARSDSLRREGRAGPQRHRDSSRIRSRACAASTSRSARITITSGSTTQPADHDSVKAYQIDRASTGRGQRRDAGAPTRTGRAFARSRTVCARQHAGASRLDLTTAPTTTAPARRPCSRSPRRSRTRR